MTLSGGDQMSEQTRVAGASRHLGGDLVDLGRRVPGALVDAHDGLARRPGRQAEDLARLAVQPGVLVVHALFVLDLEVALVRLGQLLGA